MPSGYTSIIEKTDRDLSLNEFAWRCTKAFQYDCDVDSKIVLREETNNWTEHYEERIKETQDEIAKFSAIKDIESECKLIYDLNESKQLEFCREEIEKRNKLREKYTTLLNKVQNWNPQEIYAPLKKFMLEQLNSGLDRDCDLTYYEKRLTKNSNTTPKQYVMDMICGLEEDLEYYRKELQKYKDNLKMRNDYMEGLVKEIGLPNDYQ